MLSSQIAALGDHRSPYLLQTGRHAMHLTSHGDQTTASAAQQLLCWVD